MTELETERLVLRQWRAADHEAWAELNADPRVMEHFPSTLPRAESQRWAELNRAQIDERGWGLWAVQVKGGADFIGFTGLAVPNFEADFTPCVEVGWRLAAAHWGRGYAPEAAQAVLEFGFVTLGLDEILSFTFVGNANSRRVMHKLGMTEVREFDHPSLPGHRLERHVLYRIAAESWSPDRRERRVSSDRGPRSPRGDRSRAAR